MPGIGVGQLERDLQDSVRQLHREGQILRLRLLLGSREGLLQRFGFGKNIRVGEQQLHLKCRHLRRIALGALERDLKTTAGLGFLDCQRHLRGDQCKLQRDMVRSLNINGQLTPHMSC